MGTYIIMSRISHEAFKDPKGFRQLAADVSARIKSDCPDVKWKHSFAAMGRFDVVDIVESEDPKSVKKAAMIIRALGHSTTETMVATPWDDFLEYL